MRSQAGQCSEQVFPWEVDADQGVPHREEQPATLQAAEGAHRPKDCSLYKRQVNSRSWKKYSPSYLSTYGFSSSGRTCSTT